MSLQPIYYHDSERPLVWPTPGQGGTAGEGEKRMNLIEGLQKEMNRCRELRKQYVEIGAPGFFGRSMIDAAIKQGEDSIAANDILSMLRAHKQLESIE